MNAIYRIAELFAFFCRNNPPLVALLVMLLVLFGFLPGPFRTMTPGEYFQQRMAA